MQRPGKQRRESNQPQATTSVARTKIALLICFSLTLGQNASAQPPAVPASEQFGSHHTASGEVWQVHKAIENGDETVSYSRAGVTLSQQQMREHEARNPEPVIGPELQKRLDSGSGGDQVRIFLWHDNRPRKQVRREVEEVAQPILEPLRRELENASMVSRPTVSLSPEEEEEYLERLGAGVLRAPEETALMSDLKSQIEAVELVTRDEVNRRVAVLIRAEQQTLSEAIERAGGEVLALLGGVSLIEALVPSVSIQDLASLPEVVRITLARNKQPSLDNHVVNLGLRYSNGNNRGFWANGLDGGVWDVGVIDTPGVQQNHPNLSRLTFLRAPGVPSSDADGHATGVAGIIASDHATHTGIAPGMETMLTGDCINNSWAHADWMVSSAPDDPEVINQSCGSGSSATEYPSDGQFLDAIVDDFDLSWANSAGNDGSPGGVATAETLNDEGTSYNALIVANMWDNNTAGRGDDVIRASSSRGPTPQGRKKPDITAPGHQTMTTSSEWEDFCPIWPVSCDDFTNLGGTSAASPHVAGGALLLTDARGDSDPLTTKAILINTANTWTDGGTLSTTSDDGPVSGSLWNQTYGWGYLNLSSAWLHAFDVFEGTIDDGTTPAGSVENRFYLGWMTPNEKATLVWNRHLASNGSSTPGTVEDLSDLDLFLYRENDGVELDRSWSGQDNVEQIAMPSSEPSQTVVLRVNTYGELDPDVTVENYALATQEHFETVAGPGHSVSAWAPIQPVPGENFTMGMQIVNDGGLPLDTSTHLSLPPGFAVASGTNPRSTPTIFPGDSFTMTWQITAPCTSGTFQIGWTTQSVDFGVTTGASGNVAVVTSPIGLSSGAASSRSDSPEMFSFQVRQDNWALVATKPGPGSEVDLNAKFEPCSSAGTYAASFEHDSNPDFVVTSGFQFPPDTYYAETRSDCTFCGGPYTIEYQRATSLSVGATETATMGGSEPGKIYQVELVAGSDVVVDLDTVGVFDHNLYVFRPSRSFGSRSDPDLVSAAAVTGDEQLSFEAPESGFYSIVVLGSTAQVAADFHLTIEAFNVPGQQLLSDGFEAGLSAWAVVSQ